MVYQALRAADQLAGQGVEAEVINCAVVKPLDHMAIIKTARKTKLVVTVEEGQIAGGLGGAVAEVLGESQPTRLSRLGMNDKFGESGAPGELLEHFGLTAAHIASHIKKLLKEKS
jgi:transketolase